MSSSRAINRLQKDGPMILMENIGILELSQGLRDKYNIAESDKAID